MLRYVGQARRAGTRRTARSCRPAGVPEHLLPAGRPVAGAAARLAARCRRRVPRSARPAAGSWSTLGPRAALHEVVVADLESQAEILRFPLEVDCPVIVGRGAAVKGIDLAMYADGGRSAIDTVSRQHLMMRLTNAGSANWRLSALDLNSTNGTTVERWTGSAFDPAKAGPRRAPRPTWVPGTG